MVLARGWINMYYTHRMIHRVSENYMYIVYTMALIASDQYACADNKW